MIWVTDMHSAPSDRGEGGRQRDLGQRRAAVEDLPYDLGDGRVTSAKDVHPSKACGPILVRVGGGTIWVTDDSQLDGRQPSKACSPIFVRVEFFFFVGSTLLNNKNCACKQNSIW